MPVKDELSKLLATKDTREYCMLSGTAGVCQIFCPEFLMSDPFLSERRLQF